MSEFSRTMIVSQRVSNSVEVRHLCPFEVEVIRHANAGLALKCLHCGAVVFMDFIGPNLQPKADVRLK